MQPVYILRGTYVIVIVSICTEVAKAVHKVAKYHFLYTNQILGKTILPQKVRDFWQ